MKAAFSNIFGKKKPLKEILRENKRTITRAVRDIDREKTNLEKQEKKLIGEIKKSAKAGQMGAVKASAVGAPCVYVVVRTIVLLLPPAVLVVETRELYSVTTQDNISHLQPKIHHSTYLDLMCGKFNNRHSP